MSAPNPAPTFFGDLRDNWPWWRIVGTIVALSLIFYSKLGKLKEEQEQAEKKRQQDFQQSIQDMSEQVRRDAEQGRHPGSAFQRLLGLPRATPTGTSPTETPGISPAGLVPQRPTPQGTPLQGTSSPTPIAQPTAGG